MKELIWVLHFLKNIGETLAISRLLGSIPFSKERLKICLKWIENIF